MIIECVYAKSYFNSITVGTCKPHIFTCNDNNVYVVKFMNNPYGTKVLTSEYICYRLCEEIGLPVPKAKLVYLPQELIEIEPEISWVKPGIHFGSLYYRESVTVLGEKSLKNCTNKSDFTGIISFDYWVDNDDRTDNSGNLLISDINGQIKVIMIDHSHCFPEGPQWTEFSLDSMHDVNILGLDGKVYKELINYIEGVNPFDFWLDKIETFDDNKIEQIITEIPNEWDISLEEKSSLVCFLKARKTDVRLAIESQKKYFPKWKE